MAMPTRPKTTRPDETTEPLEESDLLHVAESRRLTGRFLVKMSRTFLNGPAPSWKISVAACSLKDRVSEQAPDHRCRTLRGRPVIRQSADRCLKQRVCRGARVDFTPRNQATSP